MAFTDRIYLIDLPKLITWLIPVPLRRPKFLALIKALIGGTIGYIYQYAFAPYANFTVYWLGINSQVCYMERALNDKYDKDLRRIEIVDGDAFEPLVLFLKIENKPVSFYTKTEDIAQVLYTRHEVYEFTSDFIVEVPIDISFNNKEMRAFIDTFKTPAKTYIIKKV